MQTQEIITNPISTTSKVREQIRQEIEKAPDEILESALEYILFLKSRYADSLMAKQTPSTGASILKTLERIGTWEGDDFDECLELVHTSRSKLYVTIDENEAEDAE
ncbi:MAG: hypothetical protein EBE86_012685 [Hormoscilla sp. GUM202]|nr:hypothetical protein [Hormoscilla sp. GUM202]